MRLRSDFKVRTDTVLFAFIGFSYAEDMASCSSWRVANYDHAIGQHAKADHAHFAIVLPRVLNLEGKPGEDRRRTREVEADSNITVRRLAETRRVLAASPQYLQRHGTPRTLQELQGHKLLLYTYSNNPSELNFSGPGGERVMLPVRGLLEANDGQVLRAAALRHLGVLVQPSYIVYEDIVAGRLVPVLDEWDLPRLTINLAYQTRRFLPAKVRCFIDFVVEHFARQDYERKWTQPGETSGRSALRVRET